MPPSSTPARPLPGRRVADLVGDPRHAAPLDGATARGEASGDGRVVQVGVWRGARGEVVRARFRATTCASLVAYSEAACALVEAGVGAAALARALRAAVAGVHPSHRDRALLVVAAFRAALTPQPEDA